MMNICEICFYNPDYNPVLQEERKKAEEADRVEREKFENLPEWKQQIIRKKRNSLQDSNSNSDTKSEVIFPLPTNGDSCGKLTALFNHKYQCFTKKNRKNR